MTIHKPSCALLVADDPAIAVPAEERARKLFDLSWLSHHSRRARELPVGFADLMESRCPDYVFSLLSPVIVPQVLLDRVGVACVNFHPAPPEYPGVGACSYALYDGRRDFGATAHIMNRQVDAGTILAVTRFAIAPAEGCDMLSLRAREASLQLFLDVLERISSSGMLLASGDRWARAATTWCEFLDWMTLSSDCTSRQLERLVAAVRHPELPGPYVVVHGQRFQYLGPAGPWVISGGCSIIPESEGVSE